MTQALFSLVVVAALLLGVPAGEARAQSDPFQRLLGREAEPQARSLWYERADGRGRFVFDRSGRPALVLMENGREVIPVWPARASGGGEVWLTDTDRVLLRFSNLGGVTFFPPDNRDGVIADPVGEAPAILAEPASGRDLQEAARNMINELAGRARREISAELTDVGPEANAFIIDAMHMVVLAAEQTPRRTLRQLDVVRIGVGEVPRADYSGGVLDISVNPGRGYGGRPSSGRILQELEQGA
ncbi:MULTISPECIES: DUF4908 domain-containing protein [Marinicauda]|jgi:hypothetical protein|uniref:DUF4908 domain-containing protein n=1 Tax=Marinicauda TaxID=1649466 RepID=UPI0022E13652|nr:DUF4908 domain-containing protein [Marinicauda sp. Alg238-R41]